MTNPQDESPMTGPASSWLIRPTPRPSASLRLFCFPYAGGGASAFRAWSAHVPDRIEVVAIQPPGRETRFGEPAFHRIEPLVAALSDAIATALDRPCCFFGHSAGALVAFEIARELRRRGAPGPCLLAVSAAQPPHAPRALRCLSDLSEDSFWRELQRLEGTPPEVMSNPALRELLWPTLRADFAVMEWYRHRDDVPLECPIVAFGGYDDPYVRTSDLQAWRVHTSSELTLHELPGGHFYLRAEADQLLSLLVERLTTMGADAGQEIARSAPLNAPGAGTRRG